MACAGLVHQPGFRRGLRNRGNGAIGVQPSGAGSESGGISSDSRSQEAVGGIGAAARSTFRPWALSGTFQTGTGPRYADPTNRYSSATKQGVRADLTMKYGVTSVGRKALLKRR